MGSGPPKVIESLIFILLPPAYREHVLGDLYERYRSPLQYCVDGFRAAASIVGGQIVRTWDSWFMLAQAVSLTVAFAPYVPVIGNSAGVRIAIAIAITLATLVLCDAYRSPVPYAPRALTDVVVSIGMMFAGEMVLTIFRPDLVLTPLAMTTGGSVGALLLVLNRRLWPEKQCLRTASGGRARISPDSIRFRAHQLRQKVFNIDLALFFIVSALGFLGWGLVKKPFFGDRMIGGVILGCTVYVIGFRIYQWISGRAGSRSVESMDAYRTQLERLRDDQLRVFSSRGAPIFAAMMAFGVHSFLVSVGDSRPFTGFLLFIFLTVTWAVLVKQVSSRQAQKYQNEIDELDRTKMEGTEQ